MTPDQSQKPALKIVVLGMHRSGTSLLSGLLERAGVFFGLQSEMIASNEENPKGLFERKDVRRLNDRLLNELGGDWSEISNLKRAGSRTPVFDKYRAEARQLIQQLEKSSSSDFVGLKEPRFCLLMDFWLEILDKQRFFVLVHRDPGEIAGNLQRSNGIPPEVSHYLTEAYLGNAICSLQDEPHHVTSFSALIENPIGELKKLSRAVSASAGFELDLSSIAEFTPFFDKELYRSELSKEPPAVSARLKRWCANLANGTLPRIGSFEIQASREVLDFEYVKRNKGFADLEDELRLVKAQFERSQIEQRALERRIAHFEHNLRLLESSKSWMLVEPLLRLMFNPRSLGKGHTILDELNSQRKDLIATFGVPSSNPNREEHELIVSPIAENFQARQSLIVLNRNGEHHLSRFLPSLIEHHPGVSYELIMVDHDSTDSSLDVIRRFFSQLPIKLLLFQNNNSFSFSNNIAVRYASSDVLIFCNNDIVFDRPAIQELASELVDPSVGVVGAPLFYADSEGGNSGKLQHAGVGFEYDQLFEFMRPFNKQNVESPGESDFNQTAVTAALMACRKQDFLAVGGFHEGYNYGFEDADFCLSVATMLKKAVVLTGETSAIHDESATQRKDSEHDLSFRRRYNIETLKRRYGRYLEGQFKRNKHTVDGAGASSLTIGFAVTDDDPSTNAGDFFTAMEFAAALEEEFGWRAVFLPRLGLARDWLDVSSLDILIVMLDEFELSNIRNAKSTLIKIAWARNWFERWVKRSWFDDYDLVLCSSQVSKQYVDDNSSQVAHVLKIATNSDRFNSDIEPNKAYSSDYCFTGSYWNARREIEKFDPNVLPYDFAIFGSGWDAHEHFADSWKGSLPYSEMPQIYASTKLLVDDANHVTKPWGSVNSRVFDALASGALVLTNGEVGAKETFGNLLPTYSSPQELEKRVSFYLEHEAVRQALASKLRQKVLAEHTYTVRARQLNSIIARTLFNKNKIAIKLPVPRSQEVKEWGDYHMGCALAAALRDLGYEVRLDIMPDWYGDHCDDDDFVIAMRGLSRYEPSARHVNLMWNISHPDKVCDSEYEQYDQVFVASEKYAAELARRLRTKVEPLLQCTDPKRFTFRKNRKRGSRIVFVGNSRKQLRPTVRYTIEAGFDLSVYGSRWEDLIDNAYIAGKHIPNEELGDFYAGSGVVLNDHWETMKKYGFVSNRLFDTAACGAIVVSDAVDGISELFGDLVYQYSAPEDLERCIRSALEEGADRAEEREALASWVAFEHSFTARAAKIDAALGSYQKISSCAEKKKAR